MSIADDLRASLCAGCIRYEQPRTEYCDRCGNDEFVGPVAELEAVAEAAKDYFGKGCRKAQRDTLWAAIVALREVLK
jgi:uncharacterized OB-fold protein